MVKKWIVVVLTFALILNVLLTSLPIAAQVKTKSPTLNKRKIVLIVAKIKKVKLKNVSNKVKWKILSGKKNIKITKKTGKCKNVIMIKGISTGKAVIQARYGKRTYKIKITIQNKVKNKETTTTQSNEITTVETTTEISDKEYATVTFDYGELAESVTQMFEIGKPYGTLPESNIKDYAFNGWYTEYYNGTRIKETDICTGDITVYAWLTSLKGVI